MSESSGNKDAVQAPHSGDQNEVTITDSFGRTVTLPEPAKKIASLSPGFTEILFEIGCGDRVVLRDRWADYPKAASQLPFVNGLEPAVDKIAGFGPDLVVLYFKDDRNAVAFEKVGLPVAVLNPKSFSQVADNVEALGILCGQPEKAKKLSDQMRRDRDKVADRAKDLEAPLTYVEIDGSDTARPWTVGPGSFIHELLVTAGGRNVAKEVSSSYAQVTAESIIRANPDVVLLLHVSPFERKKALEDFRARPGWARMKSVADDRVITTIDKDLLTRPGPRLSEGLRQLFEALHPQLRGIK